MGSAAGRAVSATAPLGLLQTLRYFQRNAGADSDNDLSDPVPATNDVGWTVPHGVQGDEDLSPVVAVNGSDGTHHSPAAEAGARPNLDIESWRKFEGDAGWNQDRIRANDDLFFSILEAGIDIKARRAGCGTVRESCALAEQDDTNDCSGIGLHLPTITERGAVGRAALHAP